MAIITLDPLPNLPNDGKVEVRFTVSNIDPKNEQKVETLLAQAGAITADGKIDTFELFTTIGLIFALQKL